MVPDGCGPGDRLLIDLPSDAPDSDASGPPTQRDAVINAPTGAGKTLAFTIPLLAAAADELDRRSIETVAAVSELVESPAGSDLSPTDTMEILAPSLQAYTGTGGAAAKTAGLALPPRGPPVGLVVTPTASLAEQAARQAFGLVGGYTRESRTYQPGAKDSLMKYEGPKAVRVVSLLTAKDGENAAAAAAADGGGPLRDCEILVVSSEALAAVRDSLDASALRLACVDEADACDCAVLGTLPDSVRRVLVGATVGEAVATSVEEGWVRAPSSSLVREPSANGRRTTWRRRSAPLA